MPVEPVVRDRSVVPAGYGDAMTANESADTVHPECGGECAFAVSLNKSDSPETGQHQLVKEGRTFYLKNPVAKFLFKNLHRADEAIRTEPPAPPDRQLKGSSR